MKDLQYFEKFAHFDSTTRARVIATFATCRAMRALGFRLLGCDALAVYAASPIDIIAACRFDVAGTKSICQE
jgi:hypothetical protein